MRKQIAFFMTAALLTFVLAACGGQAVTRPDASQSETADAVSPAVPDTESQAEPNISKEAAEDVSSSKVLVAYFSRAGENYGVGVVDKGSTEIVAEMIADETGADIFQIQTVNAYPESYDECTRVAKQEQDSAARPELFSTAANFNDYDVIYLGYPIWYGDMPMAVYTFLESCDFTGKTILPFCTHAGSGLSDTVDSIRSVCGAAVLDGLAIAGTTVQNDPDGARDAVIGWITK